METTGDNNSATNSASSNAQERSVPSGGGSVRSSGSRGGGRGRGRGPGRGRSGSGSGRRGRGRGRGGRGRGRGVGGNGAISERERNISRLPAALRPALEDGGWEILSKRNSAAFQVITEEEYADRYGSEKLRDAFVYIADSVASHCARYGKDNDNPSVFTTLFSYNAAEMIRTHTTEQLVKDGYEPLTVVEVYQFIGTMLILSRFRIPTEDTYQEYVPFIEDKHKIKLMPYDRFTQVYKRLRGYKVSTRTGDDNLDDVWLQNKNRLRQLEPLEKAMFEPSIDILLNKTSGELVLDDELVGSRASDVECQNHSDRKAGKDGPVADGIADSHLGINYGFRLRLSGESTIQNIQQLLERLPTLTSETHNVEIKFDRGYGKVTILLTVGIKGYSMRTVACEIGSKHPFIKSIDALAFKDSLTGQDDTAELESAARVENAAELETAAPEDAHANDLGLESSQDAMVDIYEELEPFILDGTKHGGAQVAKTPMALPTSRQP
eukprot:scaffold88613_cov67-Cyclotella_meneghiniana.AAC.1